MTEEFIIYTIYFLYHCTSKYFLNSEFMQWSCSLDISLYFRQFSFQPLSSSVPVLFLCNPNCSLIWYLSAFVWLWSSSNLFPSNPTSQLLTIMLWLPIYAILTWFSLGMSQDTVDKHIPHPSLLRNVALMYLIKFLLHFLF